MGQRFGKGMLFAGIIGAVAGMYVMNMLDGTKTQRKIRYQGRNAMRSARHKATRIGHVYQAGKSAIQDGMQAMRH